MSKNIIYITLLLPILIFGSCMLLKKNYVDFELVYKLPDDKYDDKYDDHYVNIAAFFHDKESLQHYFEMMSDNRRIKKSLLKGLIFDFKNNSYCIYYGSEITSMFYSSYLDKFSDFNKHLLLECREFDARCVFVTTKPSKGTFIYRLNKDSKLRFYDN